MKWREFFKAGEGVDGIGLCASGALWASLSSSKAVDAALSCPASEIKILGLGGFGSRMVSRLAFEMRPSLEKVHSELSFIALDTDEDSLPSGDAPLVRSVLVEGADSVLRSTGTLSASSLVVLIAGMGGATGTSLIQVAAQQLRRTGALTVAVVSMAVDEFLRNAAVAKELAQLKEVSDVVFAINQTALSLASDAEPPVRERAWSLLNAELRILQCVTGLLRAAILPARTTLGVGEIRSLLAGAKWAGYGVAQGCVGLEAGKTGEKAIKQALASREGSGDGDLRAALIVISGPAAQLRWINVQAARNEIRSLLGKTASCLFGVQATEYSGYSRVKIEVWLAFS